MGTTLRNAHCCVGATCGLGARAGVETRGNLCVMKILIRFQLTFLSSSCDLCVLSRCLLMNG